MPRSKRAKVVHMTQVNRKTREDKAKLFEKIRECIGEYAYCFVLSVDNMRNTHLHQVRKELSDCRLFLGKTKLMSRSLGHTRDDEFAPNIHLLTRQLAGTVGLLFANRDPSAVLAYFSSLAPLDFARAGTPASRSFRLPPGLVYSTGGDVAPEHDVPLSHTLEPELRKLNVPVRMVKGAVVLGGDESGAGSEGYTVCKEGDVLDSRQTRLLKIFSVCLSEFRVNVKAYWSAATEKVTEVGDDYEMMVDHDEIKAAA